MSSKDAKNNPVNISPRAKTENFKRPDHDSFKTAEELAKAKWTGMRENNLALEYEFWILGEIKARVHFSIANEKKLAEVHMELFAFKPEDIADMKKHGRYKK